MWQQRVAAHQSNHPVPVKVDSAGMDKQGLHNHILIAFPACCLSEEEAAIIFLLP
jgi:hypothetical protein